MTNSITAFIYWLNRNSKARVVVEHVLRSLNLKKPVSIRVGPHALFARRFDRLVAIMLWKCGLLEKQETNTIESLIQSGMKVVDVGANIGYYTLQLAKWAGADGRVYAFEPECENFAMLYLAVNKSGARNIILENAGVSHRTEKDFIYINPIHGGDHRIYGACPYSRKIKTQMYALDDYFAQEEGIQFIKMDIQGAEYFALQGMKRIIEREKTLFLFTEFTPFLLREAGCNPKRFLNEVIEMGFQCSVIDKRKRLRKIEGSKELFSMCESEKSFNLLFVKGVDQDSTSSTY